MGTNHRSVTCRALLQATVLTLFGVVAALDSQSAWCSDGENLGKDIYRQQCASCHGSSGEGVPGKYSMPLAGDNSVAWLASHIDQTMPEEDPTLCVGEDAELVAKYIHEAFYSPIAQARNRPPTIDSSRLTSEQHRQSVADLIAVFRPADALDDRRGLSAEYFNDRRPGGGRQGARGRRGRGGDTSVFKRVEPTIDLKFEKSKDVHEDLELVGFAARWQGSLIAPDTGVYEIILKTDHSVELWVNSNDTSVIDAWVGSDNVQEFRKTMFLIGGRAYPLKLEFSSRHSGNTQQIRQREEGREVSGFLSLEWKRPKRTEEVIPTRFLSPQDSPEVLAIESPFPAEDRSTGYERASNVSRAWQRAASEAAIEAATYVYDRLPELAGRHEDEAARLEAYREFAHTFVETAFRRPLGEEEISIYIDRQFESAPDLETAVKRVVLLALNSPRFLYLNYGKQSPDTYDIATRLSYALWDSVPDRQLLAAAESGTLNSPEAIRHEAQRMVNDLRTRHKVSKFFHYWLHLDHNEDAVKSREDFPDFDEQLVSDLKESFELFIEDVVWSDDPDFRRLMLDNEIFINGNLARLYGFDLPEDASFEKVPADSPHRRGVVSHPYVMSVFAYHDTSSPIHRGVMLSRSLLGRMLNPPPEAFAPEPPGNHPDLTTRERVALQTKPVACSSCHDLINPLGFTLEQFDSVGRFRLQENGKAIDSTGFYQSPDGDVRHFSGVHDLAKFLAESEESRRSFIVQLFNHMVKQPLVAYGQEKPSEIAHTLADQDFDLQALFVEIAALAAESNVKFSDEVTYATESE